MTEPAWKLAAGIIAVLIFMSCVMLAAVMLGGAR
jgi:hypothetical protein